MLNVSLVFLIIISGIFYFYFKTRQFRTKQVFPIRKKMYASIAGSYLGGLLLFYGLNQFVLFTGLVTYIISAIFIVLGIYVLIFNYKAYKHYKQFVGEETKLNEN